MNELVRRTTGEINPAEAARLSKSKLMPEHIAGDAASAEYMMRFGASLGIDPMSAFQHIFVFEDKKTGLLKAGMSAHLMVALARAAGHQVSIEGDVFSATSVLVRRTSADDLQRFQMMREEERRQKLGQLEDLDRLYKMQRGQILDRIEDLRAIAAFEENPSADDLNKLRKQLADLHGQYDFKTLRESVGTTKFDLSKLIRFESTWTKMRADSIEGLTNKLTWKNYGPEMLKRRSSSTVVRDGAIDVILGVRHILGEMGLMLSEDDHDNLATASSLYSPEEQGARVDGDGKPIEGEIIDVTQSKASKQQARLVALAEQMVSRDDAEKLADWASKTADLSKISSEEKIARIYAVQKVAQEEGKGATEVGGDDSPMPLSSYLESVVASLRSPVA